MKLFDRWRKEQGRDETVLSSQSNEAELDEVDGERTTSGVQRPPSLQTRLSNLLAFGLMSTIGIGLLVWYYANVVGGDRAEAAADTSAQESAGAEITLRPLGRIDPPPPAPLESILGGPPIEPPPVPLETSLQTPQAARPAYAPSQYAAQPPRDTRLERQLAGRAFSAVEARSREVMSQEPIDAADPSGTGDLDSLLKARVTQAVHAQVLPTQRLLLPKGGFLDCTLETAIDSTLQGMTTCVLATDTFGADGTVVLLERGTKLVGETRGQVRQGAARLFVLWTEARTPRGVIVPLASPGTDELGRSGLPGEVDRHFVERFGAAILISVIDGAIQAAVEGQRNSGGTVVLNPSGTEDIVTEVLESTVSIPPTVVKPQGDRIQVLVARDLDFRSVYELRAAGR